MSPSNSNSSEPKRSGEKKSLAILIGLGVLLAIGALCLLLASASSADEIGFSPGW